MATKPKKVRKSKKNTKASPKKNKPAKDYSASLYCSGGNLPKKLGKELLKLESVLKTPVWILMQNSVRGPYFSLNSKVWNLFVSDEKKLEKNKPIAIVINSPGGDAKSAYKIARMLHQRCGSFNAYIPKYAKSAATLLSLGAKEIYMGEHAELGPLDVQMYDPDRERICSALDTVHSLASLRAFALESLDGTMELMLRRTRKKVDSVISPTMHFVAEMVAPLFNKIDVIEFTKMSRILKVAEDYAKRLLYFHNVSEKADKMASHLVEHYPEHGFFIGREEAAGMGLPIIKSRQEVDDIMDNIYHLLDSNTVVAFGQIKELQISK